MRIRRSLVQVSVALVVLAGRWGQAQTPPAATAPKPAAPSDPATPTAPPAAGSVANLAIRYRLQERYTARPSKTETSAINQSQVAFLETKSTDETGQKVSVSIRAIYSERPTVVNEADERSVLESVRHYTSVTLTPDRINNRKERRLLEDFTIWYRTATGEPPVVMVLTPGRELKEDEHRFAINYDFVTNLSYLLPESPPRLGESWRINRTGSEALVNDYIKGGSLSGRLAEVKVHPTTPGTQLAIIDVTGKVMIGGDSESQEVAVRARLEFAFVPPKSNDEAVLEATGAIEKLKLAQVVSLPGPSKKVSQIKRELILERKIPGNEPPLLVPDPAPQPTPANSWLTYSDPQGRFTLRHPQAFSPAIPNGVANTVDLRRSRTDTPADDIIRVTFVPKGNNRPEATFKNLLDEWKEMGLDVLPGNSERLPAADWPNMVVSHMEAAVTQVNSNIPGAPSGRRFFDGYVIQFSQNVSLFVNGSTFQDQPVAFRKEIETILKTVKLGPAPK